MSCGVFLMIQSPLKTDDVEALKACESAEGLENALKNGICLTVATGNRRLSVDACGPARVKMSRKLSGSVSCGPKQDGNSLQGDKCRP